jgi:hypothetical protein
MKNNNNPISPKIGNMAIRTIEEIPKIAHKMCRKVIGGEYIIYPISCQPI